MVCAISKKKSEQPRENLNINFCLSHVSSNFEFYLSLVSQNQYNGHDWKVDTVSESALEKNVLA